jgi:hypothetical protein
MAEEAKKHTAHTLKNLYSAPVEPTRIDDGRNVYFDRSITRAKSPEQLAEEARIVELEQKAAKEVAAREQAAAELQSYHDSKLQAWVQAGGTKRDFADAWPEIQRRYLMGKIGL